MELATSWLGVACLFAPQAVQNAEPTSAEVVAAEIPRHETGSEADHFTGDWGGFRTRLVEHGLHLSAGYTGEVIGNLAGGLRRGAVYEGILEMGLTLDSKKLGFWENGTVQISSIYPHGRSPTENLAGDLLAASNIDAWESLRLYETWYEHNLFGDRVSVRAGQLVADEEFAFTEAGNEFINSAFGWPAFISGNTINSGPAFFAAATGLRLRVQPVNWFYFQAGIFDGDSFDSPEEDPRPNQSGTRIHIDAEQGVFTIAEAGVSWASQAEAEGLPGRCKAGFWIHTGNFASNYEDPFGNSYAESGLEPRRLSGNHGVYMALEQNIWMEEAGSTEGLSFFARVGVSPRDRNLFELVCDGGFTYRGLLQGREQDTFGLGMVYADVSKDIRKRERDDHTFNGTSYGTLSDYEVALEAFYSIQLRPWLTIQPDVQWIHHPGGSSAVPDAFLAGVRGTIVF